MKKIITLLSFLTLLIFSALSKQVEVEVAQQVGLNFLKTRTSISNPENLQLVYSAKSKARNPTASTIPATYFYIFNCGANGFVIVSADDVVSPILGYSDEVQFEANNIPSSTKKWFENYINQIRAAIDYNLQPTDEINEDWLTLKNGVATGSGLKRAAVTPLIQTKWDQSPYYNALCPFDNQYNQLAITGCVATAMAQLMKFWNYPTTGSGFHSYNHSTYGTLSANFGSTTYQWASMPTQVNSSNTAVATLMYHCGVSVDMNYGVNSSGAAGAILVSPALKDYFGYSSSVTLKERVNYSTSQWISLLKQELDAGRPMYYEGTGNGGGHAFNCDGYDNNDYFHFNWGWSGLANAYYNINALNPTQLGSGAGLGSYNSNQKIVIGIQPPSGTQTFSMALYNYVTPSASSIYYGNPFSISSNIVNKGANTFNGDYSAAIFDDAYNFVDFAEIKTGFSLQGGYKYNSDLVFSNAGLFSMLPGKYYAAIYFRPTGGKWSIVADNGSYSNLCQFNVVNPNDIEVNSAITVTPGTTLTKGQAAKVNLNILNNGSTTFSGDYMVGLYNLDGTYVQTINTYTETGGLPAGYTYKTPYIDFVASAITADPGTYLIAVQHKPTGSSSWQLTGSSNFQNPIKVTVKLPDLAPDPYEVNNSQAQSYPLPLVFSGNNSSKATTGSNCHLGNDYDYYKINLPAGFTYSISPRLHDAANSANGNTYTLDALFSYSTDGTTWSDAFDDVLSGPITVNGGTTVYFLVSPYNTGEVGTYLLDMNITRTANTGVNKVEIYNQLNVYPNPAKESTLLDLTNLNYSASKVTIINLMGQAVYSLNIDNNQKLVDIPLTGLSKGIYLIQVQTSNGIIIQKLIKV